MELPASYRDLFADDTKAFAYLATLMPNGSPQVTPIWFNVDGEDILINSARGRMKDRNIRARPQVALVITDPKNPYRYVQVRGKVVEITEEGADDHINQLSQKYHGRPYTIAPGDIRVKYRIVPKRISVHG